MIPVSVKRPFRADIWLREQGTDINTFHEVVVKEIYQKVADQFEECAYIFDLGGNIGLTTLYLAGRFPSCRILTVEPFEGNCEMLVRNLASLTTTGRCQVCQGAVWCEDTTLELGSPPGGVGYDAIQVSSLSAAELRQPTQAYTIETLMRKSGFPRVDMLKVDIEGAETELFRGPTPWLASINAISIEFHGNSRRDSGFDDVVSAAGFIIEDDEFPNCVIAYRPLGKRVS